MIEKAGRDNVKVVDVITFGLPFESTPLSALNEIA